MIALQNFDKSCYERLIRWVDSEEALMQFAGPAFSFPLTGAQLDEAMADENRIAFKVVDLTAAAVIGHAEIYAAEDGAYLGRILVGDNRLRGRGIGTEIVACLLAYAFLNLGQSKAALNVFDWNRGAIRCYQKAGFKINPDKKLERRVNGKTWTALHMTLAKEEWQRRQMEIKTDT